MLQPGQGVSLVVPKKGSTWAAYWSGWQYLYTAPPGTRPLEQISGEPRQRGIGVFARFGFADKDINPTEWAVSGGIGGRGLIPSRDNDCFGVGYYYNSIQTLRLSGLLGIKDSTQGLECFYNIAITPAAHLTLDLQVVNSSQNVSRPRPFSDCAPLSSFEGDRARNGKHAPRNTACVPRENTKNHQNT